MPTETQQTLDVPKSPGPPRGNKIDLLARVELLLAMILTAFAVIAHVQLLLDAGHLWRDEAVSITLATTPTIGGLWRDLQTDSFPALWPLLLRLWAKLVGADNDQGLRLLGFLIGLSVLAILWLHARQSLSRIPLLGLTFLGLQSAVVCFGDAVRGYGLGVATGILACTMLWRAVQRNDAQSWLLALVAALLSVHAVFHNAPFLVGSCSGATAALMLRRQWRASLLPGCIGLLCALSLLPYLWTLSSSREWSPIFQYPFTLLRLWQRFEETFTDSGTCVLVIWIVTVGAGIAFTASLLSPRFFAAIPSKNREILMFSGITLIVGICAHIGFLCVLRYYMQPWYFLTTLAIVGISIDGIVLAYPSNLSRLIRIGLANVVSILCIAPLLNITRQLKTNVDLVAAEIQQADDPRDLIVVNYWWLGYPFQRDYHGSASWITIPPLQFPHPTDEINHMGLKRQMKNPYDAMDPVLQKARIALRDGKKVWVVGDLSVPQSGQRVALLPPYDVTFNLHDNDYYYFWTLQLGEFFRDHARSLKRVVVKTERPVSAYEDEPLYLVEGWHD